MNLRITVLTATGVYPQSMGGPAVFLHYLCSKLGQMGLALDMFHFSTMRHPRQLLYTSFCATKHLANSSIVVFNSPPIGLLFLMLFLAKILRKRTVFICHGGIFFECKGLFNEVNRVLLLLQLRCKIIDYTVVPSTWLSRFIGRHNIRSEVLTIPNGVDIEEIDSYRPTRLPTKNNVLFVGRLAKIKGVSTITDAFSILADEKQSYHLYIVGPEGDLSQKESRRIRNTPNVHFLGRVSHGKKLSLLKSVDIVVVPSLWENFPLVVLEAMACAKPVIASSVGGIPEIIDQADSNGILIPPLNSKMLAKTVKKLLGDPRARAKLSENAYYTVKNRYDWRKIALIYLEFLRMITDNRPGE